MFPLCFSFFSLPAFALVTLLSSLFSPFPYLDVSRLLKVSSQPSFFISLACPNPASTITTVLFNSRDHNTNSSLPLSHFTFPIPIIKSPSFPKLSLVSSLATYV